MSSFGSQNSRFLLVWGCVCLCLCVCVPVCVCLRKCLATGWLSREIGLATWKKEQLISEILNKQNPKTEGMSWKALIEKTHIICFFYMGLSQGAEGTRKRLDFSNRRSVNLEIVMLKLVSFDAARGTWLMQLKSKVNCLPGCFQGNCKQIRLIRRLYRL